LKSGRERRESEKAPKDEKLLFVKELKVGREEKCVGGSE